MMGHRAARPQAPADRQTVFSRQHDVEDHKVRLYAGQRAIDGGTILGDFHGKRFAHEKVGQQRADIAIILDQENGLADHAGTVEAERTQAMSNKRAVTNRYKSAAR